MGETGVTEIDSRGQGVTVTVRGYAKSVMLVLTKSTCSMRLYTPMSAVNLSLLKDNWSSPAALTFYVIVIIGKSGWI